MQHARTLLRLAALAVLASLAACTDDDVIFVEEEFYRARSLVTDDGVGDSTADPNLVDPWGLALGAETYFFVANAGTDLVTAYDAVGVIRTEEVGGPIAIPSPPQPLSAEDAVARASGPTGIVVIEPAQGFAVDDVPSQIVVASTQGTLVGWSPDAEGAAIAVNNAATGAIYTGLAIAPTEDGMRLFAANFGEGVVEVYDESFARVEDLPADAFVDPGLPAGFAPFGIHHLGDRIFVTYAGRDEEADAQGGFVNAFDTGGALLRRVATAGDLDAPWGMALAPSTFGRFADALLVGNFGDGRITAYDADSYERLGQLTDDLGATLAIDGLWGLAFGNDRMAGATDELYFTAGPDAQQDGVFGVITWVDTIQD